MSNIASNITIEETVQNQRAYFNTDETKGIAFRRMALNKLEHAIKKNEINIHKALKADLNKSEVEGYMTEVGFALSELTYIKKHFESWAKAKTVMTPIAQFPSKSFIVSEPLGVTLVMSPWNYPFLLCIEPLIGAIAAGNCCVLKPSEYAPNTSKIICKIIKEAFIPEYVSVIEGDVKACNELLEQRFDYIFFTGSVNVGKIVMEKASKYLTPVTLELGGKSPCIIDNTSNLKVAAKRIAFGKYLNSGQTCVAPDYLLIQKDVKNEFIKYYKKAIVNMFGENPLSNPDYSKMINETHFNRVMRLIENEKVLIGGKCNTQTLQIEPTLLDVITSESPIMQEEIFGPVLPILTFGTIEEAIKFVRDREKPLALYLFTKDKRVENTVLRKLSFGGGCINDTIIHLATTNMGFGGVGNSGMGSYHGKYSFETFSHKKGIIKKAEWLDLPMRYQPYTDFKKRIIKGFLK